MKTISLDAFKSLLGEEGELPERCQTLIETRDFAVMNLSQEQRDAAIKRIVDRLITESDPSGAHRIGKWEDGWTENLTQFEQSNYSPAALIPKFVKQNELVRVFGDYYLPKSPSFESDFVSVLRSYLYLRYLAESSAVCEFGCGTSHNLYEFAQIDPSKSLFGYDWAESSIKIIELLRQRCAVNIRGERFDLFAPNPEIHLPPNSAVFTTGTLEQLGEGFRPFLNWLMLQPMSICVHVETLYEVYDQNNLFDYLAAKYLEKRNYLRGFLPALRELEKQGRIEILQLQRTFGSFFHDGYTFVVWRKI